MSQSWSRVSQSRSNACRSEPRPCDAEIECMLRVQRDEPGAMADLVQRYGARVFARLYRMLGDRQEAEDLTQDVFLRVYRNRKRYLPRARLGTWIFHIARNVMRNALRTRRRRPVLSFAQLGANGPHDLEHLLVDMEPSPDSPMEREETSDVVRSAIAELGRRQRIALEMQFQDCSYSEIAAALQMTPEAAKSLLYRARHQLRESLNRYMNPLG